MSTVSKLNRALDTLDDAKQRLIRIRDEVKDDADIIRTIRELEEAEDEIRRAKREINS